MSECDNWCQQLCSDHGGSPVGRVSCDLLRLLDYLCGGFYDENSLPCGLYTLMWWVLSLHLKNSYATGILIPEETSVGSPRS